MKTFAVASLLALAAVAVSTPSEMLEERGDRDNCYKVSDKDARGIIDGYSKLVRGEKYASDKVLSDKYTYYSHSLQSAQGQHSSHDGLGYRNKKDFLRAIKNGERVGRFKAIDYVVKCNDIWVYQYADSYGDSNDDIYGFSIHSIEQRKDRSFQIASTRNEFDSVALSNGFDDRHDDKNNDKGDKNKDKNGEEKD